LGTYAFEYNRLLLNNTNAEFRFTLSQHTESNRGPHPSLTPFFHHSRYEGARLYLTHTTRSVGQCSLVSRSGPRASATVLTTSWLLTVIRDSSIAFLQQRAGVCDPPWMRSTD